MSYFENKVAPVQTVLFNCHTIFQWWSVR